MLFLQHHKNTTDLLDMFSDIKKRREIHFKAIRGGRFSVSAQCSFY